MLRFQSFKLIKSVFESVFCTAAPIWMHSSIQFVIWILVELSHTQKHIDLRWLVAASIEKK